MKNSLEIFFLLAVILFILIQGIFNSDNPIAIISAICGITYTFIAGKGNPICYVFGVIGSIFYCVLSYQNHFWGNLLLYAAYYVPMQILGYFKWNKNLKQGEKNIVKIRAPKKELCWLISILTIISFFVYLTLVLSHDANPIYDSVTTVFSLGGMYLTIRRAIEQWVFWMVVNTLTLLMWISAIQNGANVYSTAIMWVVYLVLAFYFYFDWKREIKQ